jgi:hypothetical protein
MISRRFNMTRKKQLTKIISLMTSASFLLTLAACQPEETNSLSKAQLEQQPDEGLYTADLLPLNPSVTGVRNSFDALGAVILSVSGDNASATVNVISGPASIAHPQFVYIGTRCPIDTDDTNADTFLDAAEGVAAYGQIIIPLDGDLNSQDAGADGFPVSDESGAYQYSQSASLASLLADLKLIDQDLTDSITKLHPGEEVNIGGKVVVIHGVPETTVLPDTVGTIQAAPNTATLPIACGVIRRVGAETTGGTTGGTTTSGALL